VSSIEFEPCFHVMKHNVELTFFCVKKSLILKLDFGTLKIYMLSCFHLTKIKILNIWYENLMQKNIIKFVVVEVHFVTPSFDNIMLC
jgi:hypothetical protein